MNPYSETSCSGLQIRWSRPQGPAQPTRGFIAHTGAHQSTTSLIYYTLPCSLLCRQDGSWEDGILPSSRLPVCCQKNSSPFFDAAVEPNLHYFLFIIIRKSLMITIDLNSYFPLSSDPSPLGSHVSLSIYCLTLIDFCLIHDPSP